MHRSSAALLIGWIVLGWIGLTGEAPLLADDPQEVVLLWPDGAPGALGETEADRPTLRVYRPDPERRTAAAVVICPGGGYGVLAYDHEGHQVARWFERLGVTALVLRYRHSPYRHPVPLQDAQRAIRYVRAHAEELGIAGDRIGVMGFSAGGHLASTVSTHFDAGQPEATDPIERESCRPDFTILGYPVISLTAPYTHAGSRRNLLGENDHDDLARSLSNETQVTPQTPPAFLFHTGEDSAVPVQHSLDYYMALLANGVPAELHIYQFGPHGVGLGDGDPVLATWRERLADWLQTSGFLSTVQRASVTGMVTYRGQPLRWGTITFHPEGDEPHPIAWGMVSGGRFTIPSHRGGTIGHNRVVIRNWGSVEPRPTIDDVAIISPQGGDAPSAMVVDVQPGENVFDFNLE